jgi:Xaa-Pro aminopeptidase
MLSAEGCAARRERLWKALGQSCDLLIVGAPEHLIYYANYAPSPFEFRGIESGALLVMEPGKSTLIADNLLLPYLERAHVDKVEAPTWYEGRHSASHRRELLVKTATQWIGRAPVERVGIEMASVPWGLALGLRARQHRLGFYYLDSTIWHLRRAKDPDEVALIRRSIRAGEAGQAAALARVEPGMTELDVFRIVQEAATAAAGEPVLIYGDFVSGPRCALERGGPPSSRAIEPGDLLLVDFSVVIGGYRGDFTNTFAVGGEPTRRQREMFEACRAAIMAGEEQLKAGQPARAVDAAVRGSFKKHGLAEFFTSHSGHGIGLGHPEPPYLVPESSDILEAGDVVALEPGLYIPGVGGMRYEHNYLITDEGFERLTEHSLTIHAPER